MSSEKKEPLPWCFGEPNQECDCIYEARCLSIFELKNKIKDLENKYSALQVADGCIINQLKTKVEELENIEQELREAQFKASLILLETLHRAGTAEDESLIWRGFKALYPAWSDEKLKKYLIDSIYSHETKIQECYSLCESCQSRKEGSPKLVQDFLERKEP